MTFKVGIIGTGNIFQAYVKGIRAFPILDLVACADIDTGKARAAAAQHNLPRALGVDELLADPEIQIVINLTVPKVHAQVSIQAIEAGKHVHSEKPLGLTIEEGCAIIEAAQRKGVRVGCAPDTFLGGGQQTARKLIDDGAIGRPVAAVAFFAAHGPEAWHPNPDFFYQFGGGPMFDMGPYYLTALVNLLGPARRITGSAQISFAERVAGSKDHPAHLGRRLPVEVPTHITSTIDFENGAVATVITSFDVWTHSLPRIEIYGETGSLIVPDPNGFGGEVKVWTTDNREWRVIPHTHSTEVGRGIGAADIAHAVQSGRAHRASGALALHVLELMESAHTASHEGTHILLQNKVERPAALPVGLPAGQLD